MLWNLVRFLSLVLLIMLVSHSFLYMSWVNFFNITSSVVKNFLRYSLFFLAISFFLSSLLSHFFHSHIIRLYYIISGLWYGLVIFLLLLSIMVWLLKGLIFVLPFPVTPKAPLLAAVILYISALLYTGFCFINIFNVQVTKQSIPIKNLPPPWQGKTIAHLSDLHLGALWNESFLKKIVKMTNALEPEIIVITGDLFDGASGRHNKYIDLLKRFRSKKGVFFVSGNHEVYAGGEPVIEIVKKSGIKVIDNKIINLEGLQLIGIGYPSFEKKAHTFNIRSRADFDPNKPSVLLFHTPTDIKEIINGPSRSTHAKAYLRPATNFETAAKLGISLQLSGHSHAGQFFPFTWLVKGIFNGFHYGLHRIDDFHIYISSGTGTWGPPLRSSCASEIALLTLVPAPEN